LRCTHKNVKTKINRFYHQNMSKIILNKWENDFESALLNKEKRWHSKFGVFIWVRSYVKILLFFVKSKFWYDEQLCVNESVCWFLLIISYNHRNTKWVSSIKSVKNKCILSLFLFFKIKLHNKHLMKYEKRVDKHHMWFLSFKKTKKITYEESDCFLFY